eukprot:gnl/TRDRNA2_/TRDRNA2_35506_c0_seq1.p1 gnl/TRDRNA2_/TRDRNA2_35506_c0~~gnl/TRDRNA2_/TRDRNA2_35506_c0_seq1.p1  ORF type:complete len:109 (-),score=22.94 gnl/TRDRNA2_/TRDRNA2_35506_c0_seq1:97-423(-)
MMRHFVLVLLLSALPTAVGHREEDKVQITAHATSAMQDSQSVTAVTAHQQKEAMAVLQQTIEENMKLKKTMGNLEQRFAEFYAKDSRMGCCNPDPCGPCDQECWGDCR